MKGLFYVQCAGWEVIVRFVDINGVVYGHWLNFLFVVVSSPVTIHFIICFPSIIYTTFKILQHSGSTSCVINEISTFLFKWLWIFSNKGQLIIHFTRMAKKIGQHILVVAVPMGTNSAPLLDELSLYEPDFK